MNSAKSIESVYEIINKLMGPIEAKNSVCDIVFNAISELQENGLPVTADAIEKLLSEKASDYLEASKNQVA